jgi:hypothetical protein
MINKIERQPILKALIEQGYVGAPVLQNFVVDEKGKSGIALIKSAHSEVPHNIYWNRDKNLWTETKPNYYN